jgi:hypothetical protein
MSDEVSALLEFQISSHSLSNVIGNPKEEVRNRSGPNQIVPRVCSVPKLYPERS